MSDIKVLIADDEPLARRGLEQVLAVHPECTIVGEARNGRETVRALRALQPDVVFLDIQMPGLNGVELAQVLARFRTPPAAVFVTAHEQHAVDAFELNAVDYVLKPVRAERIEEAVRRVLAASPEGSTEEQVAVERGGVIRFVPVPEIRYVEAEGDYARLHTAHESHLVRTPLAQLEEEWKDAGFVRIHRSILIALAYVEEVRLDSGRCTVLIGGRELQVSRRHTRELRDLLVRNARPSSGTTEAGR